MKFVPAIGFTLVMPGRPEDMVKRRHNAFSREAGRRVMLDHHRLHTKNHFLGTTSRLWYGYKRRSRKYERVKLRRYGHKKELVWSGASRDAIVNSAVHVRIGGAAEGAQKGLRFSYFHRFQWGQWRKGQQVRAAVSAELARQMKREMAAWRPLEVKWAAKEFHRHYWEQVAAFRGQRKRRRTPTT